MYALHSTRSRRVCLRSSATVYVATVAVKPFEPDPSSPTYLYLQVAEHIVARIEAGELTPGARLPGERDLADEYRVSLQTARRAVAELRDRGLARTVPVKGTFITRPDSSDGGADEQG